VKKEQGGKNMTEPISKAVAEAVGVRDSLLEALRLDLVGPWPGHALATELIPGRNRPSNWYLTGFLIPSGTKPDKASDCDEDEDLDEIPAAGGAAEETQEDRKSAKKAFFPSSMGLSFLLPKESKTLTVVVRWGEYTTKEIPGEDGKGTTAWQRTPREERLEVSIGTNGDEHALPVPHTGGLQCHVVERAIEAKELEDHIPQGTRSVSIFLVNRRPPNETNPDLAYIFQSEIEVGCDKSFVPRPDLQGAFSEDWDDRVADLHYSDTPEYGTGHGVSVACNVIERKCQTLRTTWIPDAEVEKTATVDFPSVELSMEVLGELKDGPAVNQALLPLVTDYRQWIKVGLEKISTLKGPQGETAKELLRIASGAADRIERGIETLVRDADALDAFRIANRSVGRSLRRRLKDIKNPSWRAFQLAFILLNLPGLTDQKDPTREIVDLLFFPTGGGKTEAYLGLAAFTMVLRRLRHPEDKGLVGAGVSVIMRYTLRLLTLDQLGRAAGLVCALELERQQNVARYGTWPFEIGLWVGKAATPNVLGFKGDNRSDSARTKVRQYKDDPRSRPSPIPIETCPWCGSRFGPNSFSLLPNDDRPKELRIVCVNSECDFTRDRALPIIAVDEPIYRRLPAFLIATVDKFATLPWVGQSGLLLGGADRHGVDGFYGPADPGKGTHLSSALPPPDLIIQDELHLISGPLGTMAGLYEAAIEAICIRTIDGKVVRPKIIASTATVRRAQDQIQALFGRSVTQVFPPIGPNRRDSFFAGIVPSLEKPARRYVGISAQGRNPKEILRRVWLAIMGAAERAYRDAGGHKNEHNPADPYMTLLGYFNSLRELGGARRIIEEQIQNTLKGYGARKRVGEERGLFQDRRTFSEVLELTSRVPTNKIAEARRRLEQPFHSEQRVDCAIATNMISVGLDIPRLGLMAVFGQPKTHAEYIQATSRVGRTDEAPGLVITILNIHRPRDRSHYERFNHYHETFYRTVEVGSVTPFSPRALDRGFAGALVTLARHIAPNLTPSQGVEEILNGRSGLEKVILDSFQARVQKQPISSQAEMDERLRSVQNRVADLLDSWCSIAETYRKDGARLQYQKYEEGQGQPLLRDMLETKFDSEHQRKFRVNRSLRDVEPEVNLILKDLNGVDIGDLS
jgi:hypothetical protein